MVCPRIDDDSENADDALAASAASDSKTAGSPVPAFDEAYDLGEDDDQRARRPRCIPSQKSWSVCNRCRNSKAFDSQH